jgi:hypothetical protein
LGEYHTELSGTAATAEDPLVTPTSSARVVTVPRGEVALTVTG